jgi:hypothetical protein
MTVNLITSTQPAFQESTELKSNGSTEKMTSAAQVLTTPMSAATSASLNHKLSEDILKYVSGKIEIIPNYLEKLDFGADAPQEWLALYMSTLFEAVFSKCDFETVTLESIRKIAATAEDFKVGTCFELAAVGFIYSYNRKILQNIEIFAIDQGNHVFLVIGRDPKSNPKDFTTWGSALVCDPWRGKTFSASGKDAFINFKSQDFINGKYVTSLSPFNPKTQTLNLLLSNTI